MADQQRALFEVRISEDQLQVVLNCVWDGEQTEALLRRVQSEIDHLGLSRMADRADIERRVLEATERSHDLSEVVLMEGMPPIQPVDGTVEWASDFFSTGFAVDPESGAIDYRRRQAQPEVSAGQLLARTIPPHEGRPGCDVFGKPIRVARAMPARIRAGANVEYNESEHAYYALEGGRIRWANEILSVDLLYVVPGTVGLQSGNISHPGAVQIDGDVQVGASVVAGGDVDVRGMVEECDIQAGGNLTVCGGISGGPSQHIVSAGTVHARFILEGHVEAADDVVVEREIVHSNVITCGNVLMPGGRIVGSDVQALAGVTVRQAGTEGLVPTHITVAGTPFVNKQIALRERLIAQYKEDLAKMEKALASVRGRESALNPRQREALDTISEKREEYAEICEHLEREITHIQEIAGEKPKAEIVVKEILYPETVLCIRDVKIRITEALRGPLRARLVRDKIRLTSALEE